MFTPPFPRVEWVPSLNAALGADAMAMDDATLRNAARRIGVQKVETLSRPKVLDEMFQALVESKLQEPTFVVDYPVELSPLAKPKRGNPALTERFELFARGREMANAFSELNDPIDQRRRFEAQARLARRGRRRGVGRRRGLSARDGIRHAADGRRRHRDRPAVHVPDEHAEHSRRDPVSDAAPGMTTRLELSIAWRYLRSRRGSKLLSLISLIAIGGVTVAVSALIVIIGVMNGLQNDLREKILIGSPDIRVLTYGEDMVMTRLAAVLEEGAAPAGRRRGRAVRAHAGGRSRVDSHKYFEGGVRRGHSAGRPGRAASDDASASAPRRATSRSRRSTASIAARCSATKLAERLNVTPGIDSIHARRRSSERDRSGDGLCRRRASRRSRSRASSTPACTSTTTSYVFVSLDVGAAARAARSSASRVSR